MPPESTRSILIIDDDPFFVRLLSDAFLENGFNVHTAIDGIEGVKKYLERQIGRETV